MGCLRAAFLCAAAVVVAEEEGWSTCPDFVLEPWPGTFGATVTTPIATVLGNDCFHPVLTEAFARHRLLKWAAQTLTPDEEVALVRLLPHDGDAPPEQAFGPLGVPGVDAEKYARWRVPSRKEVLLQGEGFVPAGHHGVAPGDLSSGKAVREWHTDGLYEQDAPSIASSMYSVSVKASGGDTLFMDAREIYDALDDGERALFDCATVSYSRTPLPMHESGYRSLVSPEAASATVEATGALYAAAGSRAFGEFSTAHPAVWQLPDGDRRRALIVAPMWVAELTTAAGEVLDHDDLHARLEAALAKGQPSEIAHEWAVGDFVVWDNRALLHTATPNDGFGAGLRLLHRIRLCGDAAPARPPACSEA